MVHQSLESLHPCSPIFEHVVPSEIMCILSTIATTKLHASLGILLLRAVFFLLGLNLLHDMLSLFIVAGLTLLARLTLPSSPPWCPSNGGRWLGLARSGLLGFAIGLAELVLALVAQLLEALTAMS